MASSGPPSVLDRRNPNPESNIVFDRITRRRSPVRPAQGTGADQIVPRISQPYRTSFSAVVSLPRHRKLSAEVAAANLTLDKLRADHGPVKSGRRGGSPRHVTYDTTVKVRHSDTEDSLMTSLSGHDSSYSPLESPRDSSDILSPLSAMSSESERSCPQLRSGNPEVLKGIRKGYDSSSVGAGDRLAPNHSVGFLSPSSPDAKTNLSKDYASDRTISYRKAIQAHYSDEVKKLAEANVEEKVPEEGTVSSNDEANKSEMGAESELSTQGAVAASVTDASSSESKRTDPHFLSHAKKSLSTSMGNFFRRLSPNVRRRNKHHKKSSSTEGSAQSLNTSDSCSIESDPSGHPFHRSNSKSRRSFMKFFGKIHNRKKSHSLRSVGDNKPLKEDELDCSQSQDIKQFDSSTQRILKSIEQNSMSDKTIYQKFKAKKPSNTGSDSGNKSQAVRPLQATNKAASNSPTEPNHVDKENELKLLSLPLKTSTPDSKSEAQANLSPQSTASTGGAVSSLYANSSFSDQNQSIDDFSLAVHTPGSEGTFATSPGSHLSNNTKPHLNSESPLSQDLGNLSAQDLFIDVPSRKPSYLKLSCSVGGYGKYSVYSSYKGIEKRSPFSSSSSLKAESRSTSSEMPVVQSNSNERTLSLECSSKESDPEKDMDNSSLPAASNGVDNTTSQSSIVNGASSEAPTIDVDYFLNLTLKEEEKLNKLCTETTHDLDSQHLPDEVSGKMRAAIGKGSLLTNQKFKQFRDLCQNYMSPTSAEEEHPTKLEDLQGFWEMVQIQIEDVYDMFAEIDLMRHNGWKEVQLESRRSSSSSQKSASVNSTPSHTPGLKRKIIKGTPESSPEWSEKARVAAKARQEARRKMLADKRAAMRKQSDASQNQDVEIFVSDK